MRQLERSRIISLCLALLVLLAAVLATAATGRHRPCGDYDVKLDAAEGMRRCMEQVKGYKEQLGIPISPEDIHATGMIGDHLTEITTTLGALEAKRTTANGDMAALLVEMLTRTGVRPGDTVGAGFSGSFPSLNLAVLCACQAMGVRCVYIASVGASTYGANQPELTFPDMACRLVQDGYLPEYPAAVTPGGDRDTGLDMEREVLSSILERIQGWGVPVWRIPDYEENLRARMSLYDSQGPIACFVGVGGNITTSGRGENGLSQGVIRPDRVGPLREGSGLLERYSASGLPVIQLLNVKRLVADFGLAFDPETLPIPGTSAVYERVEYAKWPGVLGLAAAVGILAAGFRRPRRAGEAEKEL